MNHDEYAQAVGKVVGNLQALEVLIRLFPCDENGDVSACGKARGYKSSS
jgi:hypothetical protein